MVDQQEEPVSPPVLQQVVSLPSENSDDGLDKEESVSEKPATWNVYNSQEQRSGYN